MISTTPTRRPTNSRRLVGKVPAEGARSFFCASEPATANNGMTKMNRPISIAPATFVLKNTVVAAGGEGGTDGIDGVECGVRREGGMGGVRGGCDPDLLGFGVAAGLQGARRVIDIESGHGRVGV